MPVFGCEMIVFVAVARSPCHNVYVRLQLHKNYPTVSGRRCKDFGQYFSHVMFQHDDAIPEDQLLEAINASRNGFLACQPFTAIEVDRFLSRLCDQEKVMTSDGVVYRL